MVFCTQTVGDVLQDEDLVDELQLRNLHQQDKGDLPLRHDKDNEDLVDELRLRNLKHRDHGGLPLRHDEHNEDLVDETQLRDRQEAAMQVRKVDLRCFSKSWRPRGRGSAQPVTRPTRDGQVLRLTRRSTIIRLDTLPPAVCWLLPASPRRPEKTVHQAEPPTLRLATLIRE